MDAKKPVAGKNNHDKAQNKNPTAQKPPPQNIAKLQNQKPLDTKYKTTTLFKNIFDSPFRVTWCVAFQESTFRFSRLAPTKFSFLRRFPLQKQHL
jgi:hypothetical protein